jgi:hypothetical protein
VRLLKGSRHDYTPSQEHRTMIASRPLFILGMIAAAIGIFFGVRGLLAAHEAVSEVNRKGGDAVSFFRADRLETGLDEVRAKVGGDGKLLRLIVYPGYLDVAASTGSEEHGRAFKVQGNGHVVEHPLALTGPGRLADNTFALSRLHGKTVERLADAVAGKEHATLDDVTHIIAMVEPDTGEPGWNVYLDNSKYWRAALDGSGLSNPDQLARKALDKAARAVHEATDGAAHGKGDIAACLQAAGSDVAKVQACTS